MTVFMNCITRFEMLLRNSVRPYIERGESFHLGGFLRKSFLICWDLKVQLLQAAHQFIKWEENSKFAKEK